MMCSMFLLILNIAILGYVFHQPQFFSKHKNVAFPLKTMFLIFNHRLLRLETTTCNLKILNKIIFLEENLDFIMIFFVFLQVMETLLLSPLPVVYFAFFLQSLVFHLLYLLLLMLVKYLPLYFQHCGANISILLSQLSRKYKITKKEDGNEKKKEIEKR